MLKGIGVSPGVVIGKAFLLADERIPPPKYRISKRRIAEEIGRFMEALSTTRQEVLEIQKQLTKQLGERHASIFDAHLLMLEDSLIIEETIKRIREEGWNTEFILKDVLERFVEAFSKIDDDYVRERASDIRDVGRRILANLIGEGRRALSNIEEEAIVIAHDLSPSDTASMDREKVIGFATDIGSRTSHTAIMARALEIPAVVGLKDVTSQVRIGDRLIVDGNHGILIVNPGLKTLRRYRVEKARFKAMAKRLESLKHLPAQTLDGHRIKLGANIELPEEVGSVIAHGAEGIGLYRTEFFYLNRADLPTEDEQYEAYRKVAERISPHTVIIRTLDLGGDKFVSQPKIPQEMNPFLGWRAIRFCLERKDIFKVQLRAVLRASLHGKLKIMFPMISGLEELRRAREVLEEAKEELKKRGKGFDDTIEVGAMVEIPSAAMTADILAKEVDFFSIGTNDLIQYALAVDRVNERIAYLYDPAHPAVLRLLKGIIDAGHKENIWVGMCGEMAGQPIFIFLLLGLGLDELSMSAIAIPGVKRVVRSVRIEDAKRIAEKAFTFSTGEEIREYAYRELKRLAPGIISIREAAP